MLPRWPSEDSGQQAVGHSGCVALPITAILVGTAVFIAEAAVDKQDGHKDDVEVGEKVAATTSQAVGEAAHQVTSIVEVTGHTPEARNQQLAVVLQPVG